jgi:CheY-like chemotaxis protein
MARVLLVERDPVLAAAVEDVFRAAGHRVAMVGDAAEVLAAAEDGGADAVVLGTSGPTSKPAAAALEALRTLRGRAETRDLPVVLIDGGGAGGPALDRLAALRAGASDLVAGGFDPEELLLRVERLIEAGGSHATPALSGDLGTDPLPELIQYLEHMGKSGELVVRSTPRSGRVRYVSGRAVAASCGELAGADALLTLLEADRGRFRFVARAAGEPAGEAGTPLPTMSLLLFGQWMRDELERRRHLLPVTGAPLALTGAPLPAAADDYARLPIVEVATRIASAAGTRLYDLVEAIPAAPRAVRLAVAWLIEQGAVAAHAGVAREDDFMTTREIDGALLYDLALAQLRSAAAGRRVGPGLPPFLLLAEEGVWPDLLGLFDSLPRSGAGEPLRDLGRQLRQRQGGSASFEVEAGRLALHVQALTDGARLQIGSLVPACAGMVIWLDRGQAEAAVRAAVEHLQEMEGEPAGVLIAAHPDAAGLADRLTAFNRRWIATPHAPRSLLAVLRLLQGRP